MQAQQMTKKEKEIKIWTSFMRYGANLGCHQIAERSFSWKGYQFPVCARCTGVIIGYIISGIISMFYIIPVGLCILMCAVMFFDWFVQYLKIRMSTNKRRFITGVLGGYGLTVLEIHIMIAILQQTVDLILYIRK